MAAHKKIAQDFLPVPNWVAKAYLFMAIVLLPWTIYLGLSLPRHHLSNHWDVSWAGLDVGLIVSMLTTGILAKMESVWIVIFSSTTGSLLLVDAWFDTMSERASFQFHQALFSAIVFEIPLAAVSYYISVHTLKREIARH
jgi:hypothetical protein